jgi:hypothetical protein
MHNNTAKHPHCTIYWSTYQGVTLTFLLSREEGVYFGELNVSQEGGVPVREGKASEEKREKQHLLVSSFCTKTVRPRHKRDTRWLQEISTHTSARARPLVSASSPQPHHCGPTFRSSSPATPDCSDGVHGFPSVGSRAVPGWRRAQSRDVSPDPILR